MAMKPNHYQAIRLTEQWIDKGYQWIIERKIEGLINSSDNNFIQKDIYAL